MKIISWNVNGIRAAWNHGLSLFLDENEADIYCFQETKTGEPVHMVEIEGYHSYWSHSGRKNFSGTLCLSRIKPISARYGIKNCQDNEGRVITLEFSDFYLVNCYVPNSQHSYNRSDFRSTWDKLFYEHIADLKKQKPVIICGDFNVAISNIDINKQSVTFQFDITNKKTMNVDIPDRIANNRIPVEAKYELENFYDYLIKKYHL